MTASFRAYIDESGDEGFKFRSAPQEQGSSDWFVIGAFITRKHLDLETVKIIDAARKELNRHPKKHIHWKDLKHPEKVHYSQLIAGARARGIVVCSHKPSFTEPDTFQERYRLYFYGVRHVLERISWLVRDAYNPGKYPGDGSVEMVFSNRQGMSYAEMRSYLHKLKSDKKCGQDVRIDFDKVRLDQLETQTPGRSMGLQLADAVAGVFFNALERDRFGNTEPRYVRILRPVIYRREGNARGYGFKIIPGEATRNLQAEPSLQWWNTFR